MKRKAKRSIADELRALVAEVRRLRAAVLALADPPALEIASADIRLAPETLTPVTFVRCWKCDAAYPASQRRCLNCAATNEELNPNQAADEAFAIAARNG